MVQVSLTDSHPKATSSLPYSARVDRILQSALVRTTRPKLLLVDDDPFYTSLFTDNAAALNFDVRVINDCSELAILNDDGYDLAIIDYYLGRFNGKQVTSYLRQSFGPIPVILISADYPDNHDASTVAEIYEFMHKSQGTGAILDAAIDALDWWRFSNPGD